MNKLNYFGIGPKIGIVSIPWFVAAIIISSIYKNTFDYISGKNKLLLIIGIILLIIGLVYYFLTIKLLLKGLKETVLIKEGAYRYCQNPLYANFILILIPALSLILNSWLVLTSSLAGYILFKIYIRDEYKELEKFFGEEYIKYKTETPEFFPFLFRKRIS